MFETNGGAATETNGPRYFESRFQLLGLTEHLRRILLDLQGPERRSTYILRLDFNI